MKLTDRNIFLIDGIGAFVSAIFTGLVLPLFSHVIGVSSWALYCLAIFPLVYAIYSLSCYVFIKVIRPAMLMTIIVANLFYCVISGVVILGFPGITVWGAVLLAAEILIILAVVAIELKVYRRTFATTS